MEVTIITFCLIGAIFANPISYNAVLVTSELDPNTTESLSVSQSSENDTAELQTESLSVSQSSENDTAELQSSEENTSSQSQSSESDSLESTSEDMTSEESNSLSDEDDETDSMVETSDNSMGSEENVRKSWTRVFASVIEVLSAEDNSSAEVKGQSEHLTEKQLTHTSTSVSPALVLKQRSNATQGDANLPLVENPTDSSDTSSDSADSSDITGVPAVTSDSSESTSSESTSSESSETSETSDSSDSSDASQSAEESNASDSNELEQINPQDCVNGTQSCESDEYFFQDIGDDAFYSVENLMVPDEDERELSLR